MMPALSYFQHTLNRLFSNWNQSVFVTFLKQKIKWDMPFFFSDMYSVTWFRFGLSTQLSQESPTPSPSLSSCNGLMINWQLSTSLDLPSPSISGSQSSPIEKKNDFTRLVHSKGIRNNMEQHTFEGWSRYSLIIHLGLNLIKYQMKLSQSILKFYVLLLTLFCSWVLVVLLWMGLKHCVIRKVNGDSTLAQKKNFTKAKPTVSCGFRHIYWRNF